MDLRGSRTEQNLTTAFAVESQARNRYMYYAEAAQEAGLDDIADVFRELARNEEEHARHELTFLGRASDVRSNLETAARLEHQEHVTVYPEFAATARQEGFPEVAQFFERVGSVEGRHEELCRQLLRSLESNQGLDGRTVGHSAVTMAELMQPNQANARGFIHGGELMKLMDNAAGVVAARHSRTSVTTARVEQLDFLRPVRVKDLVLVEARLTFVARSSMEVQVRVDTEDLTTGKREGALTAYFIMVALDESGKAMEVPRLLITTEEQEQLFKEGQQRYEARRGT